MTSQEAIARYGRDVKRVTTQRNLHARADDSLMREVARRSHLWDRILSVNFHTDALPGEER